MAKLGPSEVPRQVEERYNRAVVSGRVAKEPAVRPDGPGATLTETDHSGAETRWTNERQKRQREDVREEGELRVRRPGAEGEERQRQRKRQERANELMVAGALTERCVECGWLATVQNNEREKGG